MAETGKQRCSIMAWSLRLRNPIAAMRMRGAPNAGYLIVVGRILPSHEIGSDKEKFSRAAQCNPLISWTLMPCLGTLVTVFYSSRFGPAVHGKITVVEAAID
jgi:hypothetical protein